MFQQAEIKAKAPLQLTHKARLSATSSSAGGKTVSELLLKHVLDLGLAQSQSVLGLWQIALTIWFSWLAGTGSPLIYLRIIVPQIMEHHNHSYKNQEDFVIVKSLNMPFLFSHCKFTWEYSLLTFNLRLLPSHNNGFTLSKCQRKLTSCTVLIRWWFIFYS